MLQHHRTFRTTIIKCDTILDHIYSANQCWVSFESSSIEAVPNDFAISSMAVQLYPLPLLDFIGGTNTPEIMEKLKLKYITL
ncbi:MAG: hypothetical protein R3E08_12070 [Thiotrichaceae bacterium]